MGNYAGRDNKKSVQEPQKRRLILVTGGNKGIGRAVCKRLLEVAVDIHVLVGSRNKQRGNRAVESIKAECPGCDERIEMIPIDVADPTSVATAATIVRHRHGDHSLYCVVNNAGVWSESVAECLDVNVYGIQRVCEAFHPLLLPSSGRIVMVSSAAGPRYVASLHSYEIQRMLTSAHTTWGELDAYMKYCLSVSEEFTSHQAYGLSKACLNTLTMILSREYPDTLINGCTPGWIDTDMSRGGGATKVPAEGTPSIMYLVTGHLVGNGRYYGSDCVRSPIHCYREPGDPPYNPDCHPDACWLQ